MLVTNESVPSYFKNITVDRRNHLNSGQGLPHKPNVPTLQPKARASLFSLSITHEPPSPTVDLSTALLYDAFHPKPANYSAYISYTDCRSCIPKTIKLSRRHKRDKNNTLIRQYTIHQFSAHATTCVFFDRLH